MFSQKHRVIVFSLFFLILSSSVVTGQEMEIYVSKIANFAIFRPAGWNVMEDVSQGMQYICVVSPAGEGLEVFYQEKLSTSDIYLLMRSIIEVKQANSRNFTLLDTFISPDGTKLVFDATYTEPQLGNREGRFWISLSGGKALIAVGETGSGNFEKMKGTLLTILSNLKIIQGASFYRPEECQSQFQVLPLSGCRLSDGSATFKIPSDWTYRDLGKTAFIAQDQTGQCAFFATSIEFISPALGVYVPNVPMSYYLSPPDAFAFIMEEQGFGSDFEFLMINPRDDLAQGMAQYYTGGVEVAEFLYTFYNDRGLRIKGFTTGISFNTGTGANWYFRNVSFIAPEDIFDSLVPTFIEMGYSYTIDEAWARNYVQEGMKRLEQLRAQTAGVIARTSAEISQISQSIYEGKQESQEYIDYLTTSYIRGESDWISQVEGGSVYHSDSWGLTNTQTGEYYEGKPWDYVNFQGENPKYNETMIYVDSKDAWKEAFGQ